MDRINRRCAGLDVHKDSVWAAARVEGKVFIEKFGTTVAEVLRLGDWLAGHAVSIAAMESTGVYWKPIWNLLEERLALMLVNAHHVKQVPGRKTDVKDCEWIAQLLECGLLKRSFVPPRPLRQLRDLTRQRTQLLADRARVVNRVHKVLEDANNKLGSVATDITGKSGRAILNALVAGTHSIDQMVDLVHKRMEAKKPALRQALAAAPLSEHHRFLLKQLLGQIDSVDQLIESFDQRIAEVMSPLEREAVKTLDQVPGFDRRTAQIVLAEIGSDMSRFPSPAHLASWAGLCPGNNQSAGKRLGGRTRRANPWLKAALTQAAWGASRTRKSYFAAQHQRLAQRRGVKRANLAVAHSLLVTVHCMLSRGTQYADLGADYFATVKTPEQQAQKLLGKLQKLGYHVEIKRTAA